MILSQAASPLIDIAAAAALVLLAVGFLRGRYACRREESELIERISQYENAENDGDKGKETSDE